MIPILIVTHTESKAQDNYADTDMMRGLPGPFHFQVCDSQGTDNVYSSNSGFDTYDDARTAGVTALDWVLRRDEGTA